MKQALCMSSLSAEGQLVETIAQLLLSLDQLRGLYAVKSITYVVLDFSPVNVWDVVPLSYVTSTPSSLQSLGL